MDYKELAKKVAFHYGDDPVLVKVALSQVEKAKEYYAKKARPYKFETYLTYWFKRAIEDYLKS